MTVPEPSTSHILPDRIKLDRSFDINRLCSDVKEVVSTLQQQFYIYYSAIPLARNVAQPSTHDWAAEPMLKGCHYLQEIFSGFETEITSIRLMRLEAGAVLKEHTDPTLDAELREVVRLTLPVFSDDLVAFYLNGTVVPMQPGELWYLKLSERHSVENNSAVERINMSIDVAWNPWVERWLNANVTG
ncbi:aspartyl/asparaginyl beta-hydroxylase domain-containing protein [Marinicella rhabdoformis]|uniref:aspartyl/asparaginyl beta-hydroxylase domain-containing protein n=1 Tax=Marinicella rhabdoformis TaxID=2580566 RepID=UPI0012AED71D|nr:aspartyl/asparaginyl beta-hydroxylase domain-containing protein [Marinicella rhabdoformis]